jgi:ABC-type multidrug transport system ATPase subunit
MRLYAIIGNLRNSNDTESDEADYSHTREITEAYLSQLVNPEQSSKYLQMFDFHYRNLQRRKISITIKKISLFSVKTLLICEQINNRLDLKQKAFVLLQLFDILKNDTLKISDEANDFIVTISNSFGISQDDLDLMYFFVFASTEQKARHHSFMVISGNKNEFLFHHHLLRESMTGNLVVLFVPSIQTYFLKVEESDDWLYVNGRSVIYNRIYVLEKGSAIRCPKIQTIHFSDITGGFMHTKIQYEVQLAAINIEYGFKNSDNGIKKFNFSYKSGQLIGIMGGSGVGKSTLLSILNGTLKPDSGKIMINGIDIYGEQKDKVKGIIGYIPQDDFLVEELTVFENLYFNACFCYSNLNEHEIIFEVDKLLKNLGLFEIRDLKVGSPLNKLISGGQRKRLNIALELLREPWILFVDEPTSGLSSNDSEKVMDLLKQQTYAGKLIIINIHQPSSDIFKMFDGLLVLDKGGRPTYAGNTTDSLVYFKSATQLVNANESECIWCGNLNPEQILQIIETREVNEKGQITDNRMVPPEDWYELYLSSIDSKIKISPLNKPLPKTHFHTPGYYRQFFLYFLRNLKCKLADTQYLIINILEAPLLALILGFFTRYAAGSNNKYIFSENINLPAFLFMSVVVSLFLGMMGSAEEIIRDAKLLKRESFLNLSRLSYLNSKIVYLIIVSAIQMAIYVIISQYILEIRGMTISYWLILFSTSCFANIVGLNLSAGLRSVVAIYISIPLILIPQLLLSGVIVKFDKLNNVLKSELYVPLTGDIMASRWAYEALSVDQFENNKYEQNVYDIEKNESDATYCTNFWIPEVIGLVGECQNYIGKPDKKVILDNRLLFLKSEVQKVTDHLQISNYINIDKINPQTFNDSIADDLSIFLKRARSLSSKILNRNIDAKDKILQNLEGKFGSHQSLVQFKEMYYNTAIADQLLNKNESEKILKTDNTFQRKFEPIFIDPESDFGRAHFYAPQKRIGNLYIDTFWFNVMVIWSMSLVGYITLYYNVLGKLLKRLNNKTS